MIHMPRRINAGRKPSSNTRNVWRYLLEHEPATAAEIAQALGVERRHVNNAVQHNCDDQGTGDFVRHGYVVRRGRRLVVWSVWEE